MFSVDNLWQLSTFVLFLSLVRGSGANKEVAIFWQLIEMFELLDEVYTELYKAVHRVGPQYEITGCLHFKRKLIQIE